ncbi:MAG: hypothetical protein J6R99_01895 [Alphaproteobacteria bacterium]|nr:hypothetical protein [Alphaproteobacteria bacterium]
MKYFIDGKPAYLAAKKHGVSPGVLYARINKKYMDVKDAATMPTRKKIARWKYTIKKDGRYVCLCYTTAGVAKVLGTSKGTICGLFYRNGNKIKWGEYTIKRT